MTEHTSELYNYTVYIVSLLLCSGSIFTSMLSFHLFMQGTEVSEPFLKANYVYIVAERER